MCGPPIRKNTSWIAVGSSPRPWLYPWPFEPCSVPTWSSTGELTGPASMIRPEMSTPSTSATVIGTTPLSAVRVAMPSPSTIVSGRFTLIVLSTS